MSRKLFPTVALAALIVTGLLIVSGLAIHRSGWSQGYVMGRLSAEGGGGAVAPNVPYGYPGRPFGLLPFLGGAGSLLIVGSLFLLLVVIGRLFHLRAWKMAGGPKAAHWARHWRRFHGPVSPWCWGWEKPSEKAEQTKPDTSTSDAETES